MHGITRTMSRMVATSLIVAVVPLVLASPALAARHKTIRINDASIVEGDTGQKSMSFSISWTGSKSGPAPSVHYATADVTAVAGEDYTAVAGTASMTKGNCRCKVINVPILGDVITEGTETFVVNLSSPVNGTLGDPQGVGTVYDNEGPPALVVTDASDLEASGHLSFSVLLTHTSASSVSVDYATSSATADAGSDFVNASGTFTFSPGQTEKYAAVTLLDDAFAEDDEIFTLELSNALGAGIVDAQGVGTILNDDDDPTVSVANASIVEGDVSTSTLSFPVTLSGPSGRGVEVDFATADGTASAGSDYVATSGTLVFAPGDTVGQVDVTVNGDFLDEPDETLTLSLSDPLNADLGTDVGTGTINNDDAGPQMTIADASVVEGNAGISALTFSITMTPVSGSTVTVEYATLDVTAVSGNDYVAASGFITLHPGEGSADITVDVLSDTSAEPDETLELLLSNPVGAKVADATATGTITNDDKFATTLTLKVVKKKAKIKAKGLIEAATSGMKIKVTLFHKVGSHFKRVQSKQVGVTGLKDRDGDGITDGTYAAAFTRPAAGTYRFVARYAGDPTHVARKVALKFKV